MAKVLSRMKKEKLLPIQDLRTEINQLKTELVQLKKPVVTLETGNLEKRSRIRKFRRLKNL